MIRVTVSPTLTASLTCARCSEERTKRSDSGRSHSITMLESKPNRRQFLMRSVATAAAGATASVFLPGARSETRDPAREWRHYGGDPGASRYSPLDQITRSNVKRLKVAWSHHTEDASERP